MDNKILLIATLGTGIGIGYFIHKIKLNPRTNVIIDVNLFKMPTIVKVNSLNGRFREEFIKTEFINDVHIIPLRIPYGIYDISFQLPGVLIKRFDNIEINGEDFSLNLDRGDYADMNSDNVVGTKDVGILIDGWERIGDEPI